MALSFTGHKEAIVERAPDLTAKPAKPKTARLSPAAVSQALNTNRSIFLDCLICRFLRSSESSLILLCQSQIVRELQGGLHSPNHFLLLLKDLLL